MSSLSTIVFVSALFCAQSLTACGGSTDSRGNLVDGESAGESNNDNSAGAGPHSAGAPGAGAGNTAGPSGKKLSEIKTDAQALAVCNQIKSSVSDAELKKMLQGSCAIAGQSGAASQLGTCQELQADCAAHTPLPTTDDGSCTADDVPDCDSVTVDEYVACSRATIKNSIAYLSTITCDTDLQSLEPPATAGACSGPFARCPEYAALFQ